MYSKFFLVFFSLFLLLLSGLAGTLEKRGNSGNSVGFSSDCWVHSSPSVDSSSNHFQLVSEVLCDK